MQSFTSLVPRLARISRAAYGIVAALGALAIWGWALGIPELRDLGADFAPMSPAAALAFVLLATSFFAAQAGRSKSALCAALVAALIAALSLVEALGGPALGMRLEALAQSAGEMPAPMSPATCLALLALALAAPLARERRFIGLPANALAAVLIGGLAFFALLGLSLRVLRFDVAAPLLGF